ncbi:MAG: hypothetical protein QM703_20065 [Gemmatales bacterium]
MLLVIIIALVTWWGLGWYLSPRPVFTLHYPDKGSLFENGDKDGNELAGFGVVPFDREGKLLMVQRPNVPDTGLVTNELIELRTGRVIAAHSIGQQELKDSETWGYPQLSFRVHDGEPNGDIVIDGYTKVGDEYCRCLWSWNAITNQKKRIKVYPPDVDISISRDGSTLLEKSHVSPILLTALAPSGLPSSLTAILLAGQEMYQGLGIEVCRVYSLPELTLRSTINIPPPFSLSHVELSSDGRWLLLRDGTLPIGMMSPLKKTILHIQGNIGGMTKYNQSIRLPRELRIYETHSGNLWHRETDYPGYLSNEIGMFGILSGPLLTIVQEPYELESALELPMPERIKAVKEQASQIAQKQRSVLHIPSRTWITVKPNHPSFTSQVIDSRRPEIVRWIRSPLFSAEGELIQETNNQGVTQTLATFDKPGWQPQLLKNSSQLVAFHASPLPFPDWLSDLLRKNQTLADWLDEDRTEIIVYDYLTKNVTWRKTIGREDRSPYYLTSAHNYMIVQQTIDQEYVLTVLALPMKYWSPWWSRAAGLIMGFLAFWILFNRHS